MESADQTNRAKKRALIKRNVTADHIRQIHALAIKSASDPAMFRQLVVAIEDLDVLWARFLTENDRLLDIMVELDQDTDSFSDTELQLRALVIETKALFKEHHSVGGIVSSVTQLESKDLNFKNEGHTSLDADIPEPIPGPSCSYAGQVPTYGIAPSHSRLPGIPLPAFDGDVLKWPAFRDCFTVLVDSRPNLSNVEKFYYLLGCLTSGPQEALKGITVSNQTYSLAWSTLVEKYDKPRKLASNIINKLLSAPVAPSESTETLNNFLNTFDENIVLLNALNIPDLGSFLLFSMAYRCLPISTRQLFETINTDEYPQVQNVIKFIKTRVELLENTGSAQMTSHPKPAIAPRKKFVSRLTGSYSLAATSNAQPAQLLENAGSAPTTSHPKPAIAPRKKFVSRPTGGYSLAATSNAQPARLNKCPHCSATHPLKNCTQFQAASVDEHYQTLSNHRLCTVCFSSAHMSYNCPASCSICFRRHHALLHRDN